MTKTELTQALKNAFPDSDVEVTDLTGTSDHYQAKIVSDAFEGKNRIAQHRMVYAALGDAMKGAVHALALQTSSRSKR
ncbi:MAG TPA: BolA family transcriptional regulator [Polyangiaceae bacterium]|jgi:stress-induced morphogen|nr:BolA family transcriptional regulator [Polyangiaceae bacterium]